MSADSRTKDQIYLVSDFLKRAKRHYGVSQTTIAKSMGISTQALTDMKAGRRAFTQSLAEKLLDANKDQPWIDCFTEVLGKFAALSRQVIIPSTTLEGIDATANDRATNPQSRLPLLHTPVSGCQAIFEGNDAFYVEIPDWALKLIPLASTPYALEIEADDYAGRLRIGDQVLVVQATEPVKEVMLVDHVGSLKLARNSACDDKITGSNAWIALDSGLPLQDAVPVAAVVAIIKAKL